MALPPARRRATRPPVEQLGGTAPDGTVYALRTCKNVGDTLRARDPNALFPVDELGFVEKCHQLEGLTKSLVHSKCHKCPKLPEQVDLTRPGQAERRRRGAYFDDLPSHADRLQRCHLQRDRDRRRGRQQQHGQPGHPPWHPP